MSVDAAAADRLPWLADDPSWQPQKRSRLSPFAWAAGLVVLVAAGGFWMGARSLEPQATTATQHWRSSTTVTLPPPRPPSVPEVHIAAPPEVRLPAIPDVRPAPAWDVRIAAPPEETSLPPRAEKSLAQDHPTVPTPFTDAPPPSAQPATQSAAPSLWNPRLVAGASGRLVQVGAFGSVRQAKRGWWFMVHQYPAMAHLPAVVRETRNSRNRVFYRFDIGTTSQAHSEVLCQRMTRVGLSCAVVGLPWKAKVER